MLNVAPKDMPDGLQGIKNDFPVFQQKMNGKTLTYLDSASSAQKPQSVINAMRDVMEQHYANIHRGLYEYSQTTTSLYEKARKKVASFIGAPSENNIVFTRNTTESINLFAHSWADANMAQGDVIILTEMEHHANIVPWQLLQERKGIEIRTIPVNEDGDLVLDDIESLLDNKVKIVSFVHISNALGTINPARKIIDLVKNYNPDIKILVDATQSVVHKPVDISEDYGLDNLDFLAFTGHKLYGPTGIGVLYVRDALLNDMRPFLGGGDMIEKVSFEGTSFKSGPARFEAGTPAIIEAIGLGAAIEYLEGVGMQTIAEQEQTLLHTATKAMNDIDGLRIIGQAQDKAAIISFVMDNAHPSDVGVILDQQGIAVRTGHHCCMPLMQRYGIDATARASFGVYNDEDDVDRLIEGLKKASKMLR